MVYDRAGSKFRVENSSKTIGEITTDYAIITADLGRNGTVAVVSSSKGYLNEVNIYNRSLQQKYVWKSASRQVISVSVSDNGQYFAVGTLSVDGGGFVSHVMAFSIKSTQPLWEETYQGSQILSVDFKGNDHIVAVFDNMISGCTRKGERQDYDYEGQTLEAFSNTAKNGTTLILSRYNQQTSTECLLFNAQGTLTGQSSIEGIVQSVSQNGRYIGVLMRGQFVVLDVQGTVRYTIDTQEDKNLICMMGKKAVLVGPFEIDCVNIG